MATFYLKSGDTGRPLRFRLVGGDGVPQNLTGASVQFRMRENIVGGLLRIDAPAVVVDPLAGRVRYDWQAADVGLDRIGEHRGEFVANIGGQEVTFPAGPPPDDYIYVVIQPSV